jgi:hypothetical protein
LLRVHIHWQLLLQVSVAAYATMGNACCTDMLQQTAVALLDLLNGQQPAALSSRLQYVRTLLKNAAAWKTAACSAVFQAAAFFRNVRTYCANRQSGLPFFPSMLL